MKVILLQDVKNIGKKFDVKEVSDGYVRNFLIPKGWVKAATAEELSALERQKKLDADKDTETKHKLSLIARELDGKKIEFAVKTDETGAVFGSVTKEAILKALREHNFPHEAHVSIDLEHPIKTLGETSVKVEFAKGIDAKIIVLLQPQK
jgi:large subunit ribosomal protein L9